MRMEARPFFSIVIPVYNGVSQGLDRCLDSIWSQPLDSELYEVVCVDDCSADGSRSWIREQQKLHPNLRLVENVRNMRQGGSRNHGFREARGKYIMLIDQDDYYDPQAFEKVYNHLKGNDLEILIVDCAYESPGHTSNKLQHNFPHREVMTGDEIIVRNSIPYAPWKFIFKRSLVLENDLYFIENERIEDVDWVHLLTHRAQRVQYQPILFIHYQKTAISTTMTSYRTPVTTYSTLHLSRRMRQQVADGPLSDAQPGVKEYVMRLSDRFLYLGLRNYFFMWDSLKSKKKEIVSVPRKGVNGNSVVRFALRMPLAYAVITNVCVPFGLIAMKLYRMLKYK